MESAVSSNDLAWLAGIVDGEGSISFQVYTLPDGRIRITPFLGVSNRDVGILTECKRILDHLLVDSETAQVRWCNTKTKNYDTGFVGQLDCANMRVDGVAVKHILPLLVPYLRSVKRGYAIAVLEYLKSRETGLLLRDAKGRIQRVGYTRKEVELVASTRTHKTAKPIEALLTAPNVLAA